MLTLQYRINLNFTNMRTNNQHKIALFAACLCLFQGMACAQGPVQEPQKSPTLEFTSNAPVGEAKGIYPGRVTFIRDAKAALWDGKNGRWWDEGNIDADILHSMYTKSVKALTGERNIKKAWDKLFRYYNKQNGRGDSGYRPGELIAVKINLNNTMEADDADNEIDQSPQATLELVRQLVESAGVRQQDIIIYDATIGWRRRAMPDRIVKPVKAAYPDVRWMSAEGSDGVEPAEWVEGAISYTDPSIKLGTALPKAVVDATYLINVALLKGHELAGVTLCAKNHFGSIQFPVREHGNPFVHQMRGKKGDYSAFVDLMGCPNLGKKTVLYIVDGIYGMQTNVGVPKPDRDKWKMFGGEWSGCYFMSLDPVAIESVCMDYLFAEFGPNLGFSGAPQFPKGSSRNCDNYLLEAAKGTNDTFGDYRPNGEKTGSLGVFEHWNNANEQKYSRNMGKKEGIELYKIK